MEGVGARLGRSSTRYAPTTVFTGPVRKWKKKWIHVAPSTPDHQHHAAANGSNGSGAHLSLYKWTSITHSQNKHVNNDNNSGSVSDSGNSDNADSKILNQDDDVAAEEPPRKKFKYIPIIVLEEQNNESSEQIEDEAKPNEIDENAVESKSNEYDRKPDINDVPMDDSEVQDQKNSRIIERQDLNESTLELSLGYKAHEGETESDVQVKDEQLE